jgi:methionyl-tRNA formyltransferase
MEGADDVKLVFCGTPAFAVPTLNAVVDAGHDVALVISQPDRPVGRAAQLAIPPAKLAAFEKGIRVAQPDNIKNSAEFRAELEAIAPDAILIVAYGRLIPPWMLDLPFYGNINLHGSLLPKYRGAAPIQWAIARGETVTGITTMRIDEGLDTGDILLQRELPIAPDATSEDMFPLLAQSGAALMVETLAGLGSGTVTRHQQDNGASTIAPILTREDAKVDFAQPARSIYNRWRGFQPWPGAYTFVAGRKLTLHKLRPVSFQEKQNGPGELLIEDDRCFVACGEQSWLEIIEVQLEGRKRMPVQEFLRGAGFITGVVLG